MEDKTSQIPVLDCDKIGLNVKDKDVELAELRTFGELIINAFATSGFCYLRNHGVNKELIEGYMDVSRKFFSKPDEVKQKHMHTKDRNFGWIAVEKERINPERPGDLKEAFNYFPAEDTDEWPEMEDFRNYSKLVFEACSSLSKRLLDCLSVGLGLEKTFMADAHKFMGGKKNLTTLRALFYPPINVNSDIKPGQIRLGEHSDYGTITLLFQDNTGGLEANIPGQGFVPVTPMSDTVVVNIGELMQRWTSDQLIATKHRVLIPEAEMKKQAARQSVVFFVEPDDDYVITPLDGSDKYKPVSIIEYLREKLNAFY